MNWVKRNKKIVVIGLAVLAVLFAGATVLRNQTLQNTTEKDLPNPEVTGIAVTDSFYTDQLTEKEREAYELLKGRMEAYEGGIVTFEKGLTGAEFARVTSALTYQERTSFYGFVDIPMTGDHQHLTPEKTDILSQKKPVIEKCVLFLYCSEGINEKAEFDEEHYLVNAREMDLALSVNDPGRLEEIKALQEKIESVIQEILAGLPADCGQKEAIDHFLQWINENTEYYMDSEKELAEERDFLGLFEKAYFRNNLACVSSRKVLDGGYTSLMTELCNRIGIPAHTVFGTLNREGVGHTMTYVELGERQIYVEASSMYDGRFAGNHYFRWEEIRNHMTFPTYFEFQF